MTKEQITEKGRHILFRTNPPQQSPFSAVPKQTPQAQPQQVPTTPQSLRIESSKEKRQSS